MRGAMKNSPSGPIWSGLAGDELQIAVQNVGGLHAEGLGDEVGQGAAAAGPHSGCISTCGLKVWPLLMSR